MCTKHVKPEQRFYNNDSLLNSTLDFEFETNAIFKVFHFRLNMTLKCNSFYWNKFKELLKIFLYLNRIQLSNFYKSFQYLLIAGMRNILWYEIAWLFLSNSTITCIFEENFMDFKGRLCFWNINNYKIPNFWEDISILYPPHWLYSAI